MPANATRLGWLLGGIAGCVLAAPAGADSEALDSFDFMDYLGEMVEADGEWLDPLAMDADLPMDGVEAPHDEGQQVGGTAAPRGDDDE